MVALCFQFVSAATSQSVSTAAAAMTFPSHAEPFELNLIYLGQRKYRSGKMYWMTFNDLDPRSQLWHWLTKNCYVRKGWSCWCQIKRRCISWILGQLCDLYLWSYPWPWPCIVKVIFRNSCISGIVIWWCEMRANQVDTGPTVWPCTFTTLPWPGHFKVKVWNSLISGMGGLIDTEQKGYESIIHDHDRDLCITMVGWVDVPDSDWVTLDVGVLFTYLVY